MFLKKRAGILKTVTFRLSVWYALLFSLSAAGFFFIISFTLTKSLDDHMNTTLIEEITEVRGIFNAHGIAAFQEDIVREAESIGTHRSFLRMVDSDNKTLASSDMSYWQEIHPLGKRTLGLNETVAETFAVPGSDNRVRVVSQGIGAGWVIQIGSSLEDNDELIDAYHRISAAAFASMLVCGGILGWFMAKRAMSGVERVTVTAAGIGKDDLVSRVPVGGEGEEIDNLVRAFNDMLSRIQDVVNELKEVTNNIAHDLRSPITRIRGISETTMTGEQDIDSYQEMAGIVVEECDRLVGMINVMLEIAMTEASIPGARREEVDMVDLLKNAHEIFLTIAEDKGVSLGIRTGLEHFMIRGDLPQLQRMISNLLDNAIKFTPRGGEVIISLENNEDQVVISVRDTGIGIPEQEQQKIFDKFYRCDQNRSKPGNGLGLSHVRAIVRAHGGNITIKSSPDKGSVFMVTIPCG